MAKTLVKVGVEVVRKFAILLHTSAVLLTKNKLLGKATTLRSLLVGIGDIVDGYRFRAVLLANPVGIRKVDTDWRCRIAVATEHSHCNNLCRYTLNLLFAICRIDWRVVLKPLCISRDNLCTTASLLVEEVYDRLPRRLVTKRVAIDLGKAIYEIDVRSNVLNPRNIEGIEIAQIARLVVLNQQTDGRFQWLLGNSLGLLQPIYDLLQSLGIHTANFVGLLVDFTIFLNEFRVQTVGDWTRVVTGLLNHCVVELLNLLLCKALVVVTCRLGDYIDALGLVQTRSIERRVEDCLQDNFLLDRQLYLASLQLCSEPLTRELRRELIVRVVVVNTIGKPHLLQILLHRLKLGTLLVALIRGINRLQSATNRKVVLKVLVEQNIATTLCRLGQIVDQQLFVKRKVLESRHFVADYFGIIESVNDPRCLLLLQACTRGQNHCNNSHRGNN